MIMCVFSVLDKAVGAFLPPFFCRSKAEAIRSFSEACTDEKHQFHRHASDYTLYSLGEFDDSGARFTSTDPVRVITAIECVPYGSPQQGAEPVFANLQEATAESINEMRKRFSESFKK